MGCGTRHLRVQLIALTDNAVQNKEGKPAKGVLVKFSHWIEAEKNDALDQLHLDFVMEWGKFQALLDDNERTALKSIRDKLVGEIRRDIPKLAGAVDADGI